LQEDVCSCQDEDSRRVIWILTWGSRVIELHFAQNKSQEEESCKLRELRPLKWTSSIYNHLLPFPLPFARQSQIKNQMLEVQGYDRAIVKLNLRVFIVAPSILQQV